MNILRYMMLSAVLAAVPLTSCGGERWLSFHFGTEWGLDWSVLHKSHEVYLVRDGYLVDSREVKYGMHLGGAVLCFAEADLGDRFSVAATSGYIGLYRMERIVPVMLRTTFSLKEGGIGDGGAVFIEGGPGFVRGQATAYIVRTGYAYRCRLSDYLAVDFRVAPILSYSHPEVYDNYSGRYVPDEDLRRSDRTNAGIMFTIGIVF